MEADPSDPEFLLALARARGFALDQNRAEALRAPLRSLLGRLAELGSTLRPEDPTPPAGPAGHPS